MADLALADRRRGLALMIAGVLAITPDALLIRLIGLPPWPLLFWRGALIAGALSVMLILIHRRETARVVRSIGRVGLGAACCFTLSTTAFVIAVSETGVANTLIAVAAAPLIAALLSRIFLHERLPRRTWIAIAAVLVGIFVMVASSIGAPRLAGDLAALACAVGLAGSLVLIRRNRSVSMIPAMAVSAALTAALGLAIGGVVVPGPRGLAALGLMCLVLMPFGQAMIATGPRYLPAPDVALVILMETVLGPYWAWLVIDETPAPAVMLGGAVVLGALTWHAVAGRASPQASARRSPS